MRMGIVGIASAARRAPEAHPWVTASLLALFFGVAAGWRIGERPFEIHDEPLTAERSREMLVTGDYLVVRMGFQPDFKKPPLHYWLTAGALAVMENRMAAVRLWSLVFGVASVFRVAWVAREMRGREAGWVMLLSVLLYLGCFHLWKSSGAALLDTGMTVFGLAGGACVLRARGNPAWWLGWGAACALGALHKAALALMCGPAIVAGLWPEFAPTRFWRRPVFWAGVAVAGAGLLAWPLVQSARFGFASLNTLVGQEIVGRAFEEARGGFFSRPWHVFLDLAWAWPVTGVAGVAWLALGWRQKGRDGARRDMIALWLVAAAVALVLTAMSKKTHRYQLWLVPWVALGVAMSVSRLRRRGARVAIAALAALLATLPPLLPRLAPPYTAARSEKFRKAFVKFLLRERRPGEIVVLGAEKADLRSGLMQRLHFEADVDATIVHAPPTRAREVLAQARDLGPALVVAEGAARDALLGAGAGEPAPAFGGWVYWRLPATRP